jgi:nucleotide-binding universal stress UspA family protein
MNTTMTVLLAVDGSKYTRRMLNYVVSNELMFRPVFRYVLIHANPMKDRESVDKADLILDESIAFLKSHGFSAKRLCRQGDPVDILVRASQDMMVNLVVIGCRGQSSLKSALMGSVTAGLLERTSVPVLAIR